MLFNSLEFALFLPVVFAAYWLAARRGTRASNWVVLVSSYFFYGWWDWRFLGLLAASSAVDYWASLGIATSEGRRRKLLLGLSLGFNLGMLGFFKYYNFFAESLVGAFSFLGAPLSFERMDIILPVGISFYTFQTMSYTIDVYKRQMEPTRDALAFFAYVSFFPQLVAGPIERASRLLPQFLVPRSFDLVAARDGVVLILWGMFKKLVVADNLALYVDEVFARPELFDGLDVAYAAVFFGLQIYCDFSGYSDMAIGLAALLGFRLMVNFMQPYLSLGIAEFWRRWHISLSTWFRDYLYIPLGGSRLGQARTNLNLLVVFLVSGLWHGANWTFLVWGALHGGYLVAERAWRARVPAGAGGWPRAVLAWAMTFAAVSLAWVFFRAESLAQAFEVLARLGHFSFDHWAIASARFSPFDFKAALVYLPLLVGVEWASKDHLVSDWLAAKARWARWAFYLGVYLLVITLGNFGAEKFIYFDF